MRQAIRPSWHILLLLVCLCLVPFAYNAQAQSGAAAKAKSNKAAAKSGSPVKIRARASEREVNAKVPDDAAVEAIIAPYAPKVRALDVVIGKLATDLKKEGMGGGTMGNFVSDAIRASAEAKLGRPIALSFTNKGGLRKNEITAGELSVRDIFDLMPFENALVTIDLTGAQVRRILEVMMANDEPAESGARIKFRRAGDKGYQIVDLKFIGADGTEQPLDDAATYTILTTDYLLNRGGSYAVLKEGKNANPLGITIRDAVINYVKDFAAKGKSVSVQLDGRYKGERPEDEQGDRKQ
ncbi:MAG: 5'-nucleotidase C-terminal domain-containing protein [Pyrinomonadaceae bacterium]